MFHDGNFTATQELHKYSFGHITGNYYVVILIKDGGSFKINDDFEITSTNEYNFAITSRGIYNITKPNSKNETWELFEAPKAIFSTTTALEEIKESACTLKEILFDLGNLDNKEHSRVNSTPTGQESQNNNQKDPYVIDLAKNQLILVEEIKGTITTLVCTKPLTIQGSLKVLSPKEIPSPKFLSTKKADGI